MVLAVHVRQAAIRQRDVAALPGQPVAGIECTGHAVVAVVIGDAATRRVLIDASEAGRASALDARQVGVAGRDGACETAPTKALLVL